MPSWVKMVKAYLDSPFESVHSRVESTDKRLDVERVAVGSSLFGYMNILHAAWFCALSIKQLVIGSK
jgi:hypothetical protein